MIEVVINIFIEIFHFFLRIFKKALCCLKRRRRQSYDPFPLTNIGIGQNGDKTSDFQSWSSWEEMPQIVTDYAPKTVDPIQQKIEEYREQRRAFSAQGDAEDSIDFFQDMQPQIVKPKKVYIPQTEPEESLKTNFSFAPDPTFFSSELGVWEECQSWEDQTEDNWETNKILREKKRLDREKRLAEQRKRHEKDSQQGRAVVTTQ